MVVAIISYGTFVHVEVLNPILLPTSLPFHFGTIAQEYALSFGVDSVEPEICG